MSMWSFKRKGSKDNRVSGFRPVLTAIFAAAFVVSGLAYFLNPMEAQAYTSDFDTPSFRTEVTVNGDNSFDITETITVNFHQEKHGIYRYIPMEGTALYEAYGKKTEQSRKMKIDRVRVEGYPYDTYKEEGNRVIRVGDPDKTVSGRHTYKISYRCRAYDDKIDDYDLFYYNVLPSGLQGGWETPIGFASVRIVMPKDFEQKNLNVFAGYYGGNEYRDRLSVKTSGRIIELESTDYLPQGAGVTVQVFLPEGYFQNEMSTDWAYLLLILLCLFFAAVSVLLWVCLGKDRPLVQTVEFYPPEGLTSADIGYIIDGSVDRKDIISMILYFAEQGYLTIEEKEKGTFVLNKVRNLPAGKNPYEYTLINGLFSQGHGQRVELSQLKDHFFEHYQTAAGQLKDKYKDREKRIFYKSGNIARFVSAVLMVMSVCMGILLSSVYVQNMNMAIGAAPAAVILLILYGIGMFLYDRKDSMTKAKFVAGNAVIFLLSALTLAVSAGFIAWMAGPAAGFVTAASAVVSYICARQMRKRTPYGTAITGRILGFRRFIETCELERLKLLANENPAYFYNILPYAYVFGLSDTWARKFESIAVEPPSWYRGYYGGPAFNTWIFMNAFHPCAYAMQQNLGVPAAASDSGGGGFSGSSFSGGGFSGGGFGGGGGGAW